MTILVKGERTSQIITAAAADNILLGFSLPAESVLKNISVKVDVLGTQQALEREVSTAYAVAGYLLQLEDPDSPVAFDALWDRFVPKYTDVDVIDLDTAGQDATPFWEPGEANFDELFDVGDMPLKLFMRRKFMNWTSPGSSGFRFQPAETPFEPQWVPGDSFRININRPIRVRAPSVVMFALAAPALDDTTTTPESPLTENEWGQIQYVESTLERALLHQLGLVEAGAETPWEEASALLRKHLARDIFEQTAASFLLENFIVYSHMQFSHTVPGTMDFSKVDITP